MKVQKNDEYTMNQLILFKGFTNQKLSQPTNKKNSSNNDQLVT